MLLVNANISYDYTHTIALSYVFREQNNKKNGCNNMLTFIGRVPYYPSTHGSMGHTNIMFKGMFVYL